MHLEFIEYGLLSGYLAQSDGKQLEPGPTNIATGINGCGTTPEVWRTDRIARAWLFLMSPGDGMGLSSLISRTKRGGFEE